MNYQIIKKENKNYFVVEASGTADPQTLTRLLPELLNHSEWATDIGTILDFSQLSIANLNFEEITQLSTLTRSFKGVLGAGRCALVVGEDVEFGLGRMWQLMTESYVDIEIDVFNSRVLAESWLDDAAIAIKK